MIIINLYHTEEKDGKIYVRSAEETTCPICSSKLQVIGSRKRKSIETDGIQKVYVIRRLRCAKCNMVHHELPDLFVPYKRHCAETIEQVVSDETVGETLRQTTVQRIKNWWDCVVWQFSHIKVSLEMKYDLRFPENLRPQNIIRALANSHSWIQTRSAYVST